MVDMPKTPTLIVRQRQVERVRADVVADQQKIIR
jgi:hypothetical protein